MNLPIETIRLSDYQAIYMPPLVNVSEIMIESFNLLDFESHEARKYDGLDAEFRRSIEPDEVWNWLG